MQVTIECFNTIDRLRSWISIDRPNFVTVITFPISDINSSLHMGSRMRPEWSFFSFFILHDQIAQYLYIKQTNRGLARPDHYTDCRPQRHYA